MICLRCDNETEWVEGEITVEQEFRNQTFKVKTPGVYCKMCGWETVRVDRVDLLRRNTADEYRRKHGLLTSHAIRAMREFLCMNQVEFAKYMGVGEASVKRWETWLVQDRSNDELLRLKFMQGRPRRLVISLEEVVGNPHQIIQVSRALPATRTFPTSSPEEIRDALDRLDKDLDNKLIQYIENKAIENQQTDGQVSGETSEKVDGPQDHAGSPPHDEGPEIISPGGG